jgi:hypothetical protein
VSSKNARQTVLWTVLMCSVFASVLTISMLPARAGVNGGRRETLAGPGPQDVEGPAAEPDAPAVNPWARFAAAQSFSVRAEDAAVLQGAMLMGSGPDNEGVIGDDGRRPGVRYIWCPDDGLAEEEREEDTVIGSTSGDHWAEFDVDVPAGATYYPWARVWWEDSCGNSIVVAWQKDEGPVAEFVVQDGTLESWHWLPVAGVEGVSLEQGTYRLVVRNREDGARLSRLFFSGRSYENYKPETPEG